MISIEIIDRVGELHVVEAPTDMGLNLMELCKAAELPVEGTCGGMALCASCQCYLLSDHALPDKSEAEEDMLNEAFFVQENSRLGCQIHLSDEINGLKIELAPEEH
jgi:2Fe-2S ferredoxin